MIANRAGRSGLLSFLRGGGHENAGTCQVANEMAAEVLGALARRITSEG